MKKLIVVAALLAGLAIWPAAAAAGTHGVVVGKLGHSRVLVASPAGAVQAFRGHAAVGSAVVERSGQAVVIGRASRAHIRGIVMRRVGSTMFIASDRHLVAVHTRQLSWGSPTPTNGVAGQIVSTTVSCDNGQLTEVSETDLGTASVNSLQIQATVAGVAPGSVTLAVNGQNVTLGLPAGLTLPSSLAGQTVLLTLPVAAPAQQAQGDDDQSSGDDENGDQGGGGDQNGGDQGGGGDSGGSSCGCGGGH